MTTIRLDDLTQLDSVIEQTANCFEKWEDKVHILWEIISQYMNNPLKKRELDSEELREDIRFDLQSSLEHG